MNITRRKSSTAALMTIAMTTIAAVPLCVLSPVQAQYNLNNLNDPRSITIPANVTFPVTYEKEKIVVSPGETLPLTLKIAKNIIDSHKNILIPANTQVVGQIQPVHPNHENPSDEHKAPQGVHFVATELIFDSGKHQPIDATSPTITKTETISQGSDSGHILTDAAIGAGAATLLGLLVDRSIKVIEPVGGAAAGAIASVLLRKKSSNVFVLRPEQDLAITLNSGLTLDHN
jgi:hypothetical protein